MSRLFKRFFYRTIEKKYGYIKPCDDKVEISRKLLCAELELNPRVLRMFGLITSYQGDAMVDWITYLKVMALFLLLKPMM